MNNYLKISIVILILSFCINNTYANNVSVGTPTLVEQNNEENSIFVQFDLSWDNSWRTTYVPSNYDGVWLFLKYQLLYDGTWHHVLLSPDNHSTGSQDTNATIYAPDGNIGVLFYRSDIGNGTFASTNVKLKWNYGSNNLGDNITDVISEIKVFAIEMVYVPEGAYYLGSGGNEAGSFFTYGTNLPYYVESEDAINVGTTNGYLYYPTDNSFGDRSGPVPAAYPKGFASFWCMKYEITQEQYVDFLNTLTQEQKNNRFPNQFNNYRHYIKLVDGVFGCDGNNNNIFNDTDDGNFIACNYLSLADCLAYADWAGLRPMTELEYEKACRGVLDPVPNESAWGTTNFIMATGINNPGTAFETRTPENANYNPMASNLSPARVGNFARSGSTRQSSGGTFYGIMEMTGNLDERVVNIGNSYGRAFTGINGDGTLNTTGNANVPYWPNPTRTGTGTKGGSNSPVSYRGYIIAGEQYYIRKNSIGFRCVISCP